MTCIHEKIRLILQASPTLTQRGLAQRMGLDPAAVNRMLYGQRKIMAEEIPVIESYLGVSLASGAVQGVAKAADENLSARVPVYALPLSKEERQVIDRVPCHPAQAGVRDAFALYIPSDDMEPRYFRGELVYIHPHRPAAVANDCVVVMKSGETKIGRIVGLTAAGIKLAQFNPPREKTVPEKEIVSLYMIVGRG